MNPLNDHPAARRVAYYVQFVLAGLVLLVGVGYGAAGVELPTWYAVTAAVTSGAWSYLGLTAAHNVTEGAPAHRGERGAADVGTAVLIAVLVLLVLILVGVLPLR